MSRRRVVLTGALLAIGALLALLATASALLPAMAYGDGDPASDVLVSQALFMPYDTGVSSTRQAQLEGLLRSAQQSGLTIRVAMIPSEYDLGSVGVLWRNPRTYARFLGIELSLTYTGRLLVVMPNGFGIDWPHHTTAAADTTLARVPIGAGGAGLVSATEAAIRRLAAAEGITLSSRPSSPSSGTPASSPLLLIGGALLALALLAVVGSLTLLHRWRELGGLLTLCVGLGVALIVVTSPRHAAGSSASTSTGVSADANAGATSDTGVGANVSASTGAGAAAGSDTGGAGSAGSSGGEGPVSWPAGQRPAPDFQLTDQAGRTVSPADYRGRPVIVTFIDPLCRNLCPLAGKVLSEADNDLPAGQRPPIIAVSVDIYADTRADLQEDYRRWSLTSQWQWAVGSPDRLASVWKRYYAEVQVETKHIAGTTVHYITHSEMAYLIDGRGDERKLFTWPYTARQIDAAVRGIS